MDLTGTYVNHDPRFAFIAFEIDAVGSSARRHEHEMVKAEPMGVARQIRRHMAGDLGKRFCLDIQLRKAMVDVADLPDRHCI